MLLYLTLLIFNTLDACVHTQSYWLSNSSEPWPSSPLLNQPLCGLSWYQLMHLNTSHTREPGPMHWLLAFHQLCTAHLNLCIEAGQASSGLRSSVALSIDVVFDSMQRYCDDLYAWTNQVVQDQILAGNLRRIIEYNHASKVCNPILFSFTHEPQLFFTGYNETEQEETRRLQNERQHIYNVNTALSIFLGCAILLIIGMGLHIIVIYRKRRQYSLFKSAVESETYNASGCEQHDLDDSEIELDYHDKKG